MVNASLQTKSLILEYDMGVVNGKQVIKNKSYSNIRETATDEGLFNTATTLSSLQERDLLSVKKRETSRISSE